MAENRVLDLQELERSSFQQVLADMDRMVASDPVSYLHPGKRWEYPWALERAAADLVEGARVLDVGAGDSIFPVYLATRGLDVTAVDVAFDGSLAAHHGVDVKYVQSDMAHMPLLEESFDVVFCISVIEHLPEPAVPWALAELRRVVKPDGALLLTTDYYDDAEAEIWHRSADQEFQVDWRVFDEDRLRRLILDDPNWRLDGELDLQVDWERVKPAMRHYHGYPYTSVGVKLVPS